MRSTRLQAGFSAVEVLVVIAIVGLLAALALPGWRTPDDAGQTNSMVSRLTQLRSAIDCYWTQHDGFPGPDDARLREQLVGRTDRSGSIGTGAEHVLGPYLRRGIPVNPLTGDDSLKVVASMPNAPDGASAWIYCPANGEVRCNTAGATPEGLPLFDL